MPADQPGSGADDVAMPPEDASPAAREYRAALAMLRAARSAPGGVSLDLATLRQVAPLVDHCALKAREAGVRPEHMLIDVKDALGVHNSGASAAAHEELHVQLIVAAIQTYYSPPLAE